MDWIGPLVKDGGIAGAVIVIVILFLRAMQFVLSQQKEISFLFATAIKEQQEQANLRIEAMTQQFRQSHKETQEIVNDLVREQIEANTKMTVAIEGLERAVTDLQKKG